MFHNPAIHAARVAYRIALSYETSEPVVLHAKNTAATQEAVALALQARDMDMPQAAHRHVLNIDAEHSVHGTYVHLEDIDFGEGDGLITAVVTLRSKFNIGLGEIQILSDIRRQIEDACEDSAEVAPYISEFIHIIEGVT